MRVLFSLLCLLALAGCDWFEGDRELVAIAGQTMGTTYQVKAVAPPEGVTAETLRRAAEQALAEVNGKLNNWDRDSEISVFNAARSTDPITPSPELTTVMAEAFRLHEISGGRFDVTLAPLIDLWGFGPGKPKGKLPDDAAVEEALEAVGMRDVLVFDAAAPMLKKNRPGATVNLSAIAKGYGVDRIAAKIEELGVEEYLVEIGGDLICKGRNAAGDDWQIGVEKPDAGTRNVQLIMPVSGFGVATSGDYRNFVEKDGKRYSHIIDPVTGRPVTHALASVTVLADTAMAADGLATALLVLGPDEGLALAEREGVATYFIIRADGGYKTVMSSRFTALREKAE